MTGLKGEKMSIARKMQLLSAITILGFIAIGVAVFISLSNLQSNQNDLTRRTEHVQRLLEVKASALSTIQLDPTTVETAKIFADAEKNIELQLEQLEKLARRPAIREQAQHLRSLWQRYDQDSHALMSQAKTDAKAANDQLIPLYNKEFVPLQQEVEAAISSMSRDCAASKAKVAELLAMQFWLVLAPLMVLACCLLLFVTSMSRGLRNTLQPMLQALQQLSTGQLATRLPAAGKDELAAIAQAVNQFIEHTHAMVQQFQQGSQQLSSSAVVLYGTAREIVSSVDSQNEAAASMAAAVEQMSVSVNHVANNAGTALQLSHNAGEISRQGGQIIHDAAAEMSHIVSAVHSASDTVQELNQHSRNISAVVQVIKEIADQTNLLALNASIEAARAGEQGRGFAVVADEVRSLAERTSSSTQEIGKMISQIQGSTNTAAKEMEQVVLRVGSGEQLAKQAGERMSEIQSGAEQVIHAINAISTALQQQSATSHEIAAQVEKVAKMTEDNHGVARHTSQSAGELEQLAGQMQGVVSRFRT
ncbi:hypothetical protein DBR44_12360 [Aquitalea sp. FJL05]|nr:hypothetical protein DBR44_12360 [Aquitalea sp. FJL05]